MFAFLIRALQVELFMASPPENSTSNGASPPVVTIFEAGKAKIVAVIGVLAITFGGSISPDIKSVVKAKKAVNLINNFI
jgi:hypothetical protein